MAQPREGRDVVGGEGAVQGEYLTNLEGFHIHRGVVLGDIAIMTTTTRVVVVMHATMALLLLLLLLLLLFRRLMKRHGTEPLSYCRRRAHAGYEQKQHHMTSVRSFVADVSTPRSVSVAAASATYSTA